MPGIRIFLLVAGLAALAAAGTAAPVEWRAISLDAALAEASATDQFVIIDVRADHCGACQDMDTEFWDTDAGGAFVDGMIPLKIDSTTPPGADLARRYPVTGLPLVLFLRPDGTELDRVVGYDSKEAWIKEATPLKEGYDPLPDMEKALSAHPDSLPLMMPILERYLYRWREDEARTLMNRIMTLDPMSRNRLADQAIAKVARHLALARFNMAQSMDDWKLLLDKFPLSGYAGAAVDGTLRAALALGKMTEWQAWLCELLQREKTNGRLQYAAAMTAHKNGLRGRCWADAARNARTAGVGGVFLDTIAVELGGGPPRR